MSTAVAAFEAHPASPLAFLYKPRWLESLRQCYGLFETVSSLFLPLIDLLLSRNAKNEALSLVLGGISRFRNFDEKIYAFRLTGVEGFYFPLNQKIVLYF